MKLIMKTLKIIIKRIDVILTYIIIAGVSYMLMASVYKLITGWIG